MHWLVLLPYYFIGSIAALPLLVLLGRLLRLQLSVNTLVGGAIVLTLVAISLPLASGWMTVAAFSGRPLLLLLVASLVFAALDLALSHRLPSRVDDELRDL